MVMKRRGFSSEVRWRLCPWVLSRSPMSPDMSPRDTAQHLSALAPSARKRKIPANHLRTGRLQVPPSVATRKLPKLPARAI